MGVTPGAVIPGRGAAALKADGYRFVVAVEPAAGDFDPQGHLNNASTVRLFNDLRMAYVRDEVGAVWVDMLRRDRLVVAARELHVLYESEGLPGEEFIGALRYVRREGKAAVLEQRLVEGATGRAVARAWVVQLLVQDGKVVDWPAAYFARVAAIEGREIQVGPRRPPEAWGPSDYQRAE
ncbi:MAG: Thioesterase-like superfamily [Actinomycetota bacterium]|nr:Thioesterase-like superfamily [Actinomycetota bacterium]